MTDCIFCKIIAGEIPAVKVWEDENFIAILDINAVNLGHALLIPRSHHRNILEMPDELLSQIGSRLKVVSNGVRQATGAEGINIISNNEEAAGQIIFHTHIHIVPRFKNDGFEHWHGKSKPSEEELIRIGEKIKSTLA